MNMATFYKNKGDNVFSHLAIQNIKFQVTQVPVPVLPKSGPTTCKMDNISVRTPTVSVLTSSSLGYLKKSGPSECKVTYLCKNAKEKLCSIINSELLVLLIPNPYCCIHCYLQYLLTSKPNIY